MLETYSITRQLHRNPWKQHQRHPLPKLLLEKGSGTCGVGSGVVGVIEHNLDVISCADWIIDLGSDGEDKGSRIMIKGELLRKTSVIDDYSIPD